MPAPIVIEITPRARAVILKLQKFPQEIGQAIKRGMDEAGIASQREITEQRFSGKGPYPVPEHRLGSRTERLKQSLFWRPAQIETAGSQVSVTGTMGSFGVIYFPWHEYGLLVKPHSRKSHAKKPKRLMIPVKGYSIPERAPLRTGIQEHKILFQQKIQQQLEATLASKT